VASLVVAGAYRFDNGWTVGFAPHLGYSRFKSDMLTLRFRQTKGSDDWDDALGAGFSLGVYKDFGRFSLGAAYTSPRWFQEFEDYDDLFFDSMDLPQNIQAGVAYDIRDDLELALDYKWINWSGVDQVAEDPLQGGFGWEDQHIVKAGLTWEVNEAWKLRTGVSHGNSPIEEEVVFANALFPAITETHLAAGATYAFDEKHAVHFTYMHAFENELTDSGRGDLFSKLGRGTEISLKEDTFTVQYSLKF
jgi:long-chain fatty acid transport protein